MKIKIDTKFDVGEKVFYITHSTSFEEIPCEHCSGNYREIVNGIEYTCPYCKGGRERKRIDKYKVKSGIITNIRFSVNGIDEFAHDITGNKIETKIRYCVTENLIRNGELFEIDGSSHNKFEGELFKNEKEAKTKIEKEYIVTHLAREWKND